jgi:hypothetical protein
MNIMPLESNQHFHILIPATNIINMIGMETFGFGGKLAPLNLGS